MCVCAFVVSFVTIIKAVELVERHLSKSVPINFVFVFVSVIS